MAESVLSLLAEQTGLPKEAVYKELQRIVKDSGGSEQNIELDDLREILANYLQDVFAENMEAG